MGARDEMLYEYSVIRYVPRIDREEFMNIGLLMLCKRKKWICGRIELNEKRILALDPKFNPEELKRQSRLFELKGLPFPDLPVEEQYRWLTATKSAVLQVSPSHPGLLTKGKEKEVTEHLLQNEFDRLFKELVAL